MKYEIGRKGEGGPPACRRRGAGINGRRMYETWH